MHLVSRRHFLAGLAAPAVVSQLGRAQGDSTTRRLTILHTNDIHARFSPSREGVGGLAYLATAIKQERTRAAHSLYLDAGDFVQGSPVSSLYEGVPVYEVMNLLEPDAVAMGNHEFDYGWQRVYDYLAYAQYPLFCANLVNQQGLLFTPPPYLIRDLNGVRIAIIALMTPRLPELTYASNLGPWRVLPLAETLRHYIQVARERDGAQMFIALTHIFPAEEAALLHEVPEAHLIISGHDHGGMREILRDGNRMVVRTRPFTAELGRIELQFDTASQRVTEIDWARIPVNTSDFQPDPVVDREVQKWEARVSAVVDGEIGEAIKAYNRTEMRDVVERSVKETLGTDFVFINRGAVRSGLSVGKIHAREIWDALPFGNRIVIGRIAGSRLPQSILRGASVEPDKLYSVATLDYVAANQREIETEGLEFPEAGPFVRELMIEWVEKRRVVD
ncbi:MAG: bifunctional metallophosphatase/5'-nucleotidase [Bryobacterales bacterium]|nr:bifunctional metallophosphatase/5'-nucleotidase [Bryobacterales bacterium]